MGRVPTAVAPGTISVRAEAVLVGNDPRSFPCEV